MRGGSPSQRTNHRDSPQVLAYNIWLFFFLNQVKTYRNVPFKRRHSTCPGPSWDRNPWDVPISRPHVPGPVPHPVLRDSYPTRPDSERNEIHFHPMNWSRPRKKFGRSWVFLQGPRSPGGTEIPRTSPHPDPCPCPETKLRPQPIHCM